jgi:hypothetical protein
VEQSFNEQLFRSVFDYKTLFSHDDLPYHLLPKNHTAGRRYDDFSLGFFDGRRSLVLGTAELKSPGVNLDAKQTSGRHRRTTPVEQAFGAALKIGPTCRWVLACNFRELRLYSARDPQSWLCRADLHGVRNADDLARLCAHFDRCALLGEISNKTEPEMTLALEEDGPSLPLQRRDQYYRIVFRFTPREPQILPLFKLEQGLKEAIFDVSSRAREFFPDEAVVRRSTARNGWVSIDGERNGNHCRVGASRLGDVFVSAALTSPLVRRPGPTGGAVMEREVTLREMERVGLFLAVLAPALYRRAALGSTTTGVVTADLLDVKRHYLKPTTLLVESASDEGVSEVDEISAGEFEWQLGAVASEVVANCLCELAVQFRGREGGVGLDHKRLVLILDGKLRA